MGCVDADYIEEGYAVLIRLVCAIEEEDFRVRLKVGEGLGVGEEDSCYLAVWCVLYLALESVCAEVVD